MPNPPRLLIALALALALGAPLRADDVDAGAYLAARVAEAGNDFRSATAWYGRAILSDPGNARLLEGAILAELGTGDLPLAIEAAEVLELYQWGESPPETGALADELADVTLYLLQLASISGVDLESAVLAKLDRNYSRAW